MSHPEAIFSLLDNVAAAEIHVYYVTTKVDFYINKIHIKSDLETEKYKGKCSLLKI